MGSVLFNARALFGTGPGKKRFPKFSGRIALSKLLFYFTIARIYFKNVFAEELIHHLRNHLATNDLKALTIVKSAHAPELRSMKFGKSAMLIRPFSNLDLNLTLN